MYSIGLDWSLTALGELATLATTPVTFTDNGLAGMLVDGTVGGGYSISLANGDFAQISDPSFSAATRVDNIDTFVIWNVLGTAQWRSSLSNELAPFDPLYLASKSDYPDPLVGLIVNRHEILLIGELTSEIWYDAGNAQFPFAELPGAFIEHGCAAPYSIASQDISVYWLSQDKQGQGMVFRQRGYETRRISNHALEFAIQSYATISDALAYTYQQGGHVFYVLSFPSADATWVYDDSTEQWHQRCWTDANGNLHRERGQVGAFINGQFVVGDWENGTLYALDQSVFTDEVNGAIGPISWIRTFPHILAGTNAQGQLALADGKRLEFQNFIADVEVGTAANGETPTITIRYSDDRGKTFSGKLQLSLGESGQYLTQPIAQPLGIARDRVFEIEMSIAAQAALNGAWVNATILDS